MTDMASSYWLFGWLDSHGIRDDTELRRVLGNEGAVTELREVAEAWQNAEQEPTTGINLVAGTGLRLDDFFTCPSLPCRRQQIDVLFRHAWHYFDTILLPDGVGRLLLDPPKHWDDEYFLEAISNLIACSMYIRDLGATPLVSYYPKQWKAPKRIAPAGGISESAFQLTLRDIEDQLIKEGEIHFDPRTDSGFAGTFHDPLMGIEFHVDVPVPKGKELSTERLRQSAAHFMMHRHVQQLMEDLHFRELLKGTLGSVVWTHERALGRIGGGTARDVILRLSLPSIAEIPVKELIAIRLAEGDSFTAFRTALTKAAQDILADRRSESLENVSQAVVDDVVQPELAKLTQRLRAAKRSLMRKSAVSLVLAAVATKCGLLLGIDPTVAELAGIGAATAGSVTASAKYIDEKQSIELSDMYFLWKALGHAE